MPSKTRLVKTPAPERPELASQYVQRRAEDVQYVYEIKVRLDQELFKEVSTVLHERGITVDDLVITLLRGCVGADKKYKPVDLHDDMPIGKFKGTRVETLIRADPDYVNYCHQNVPGFALRRRALNLLNELLYERNQDDDEYVEHDPDIHNGTN